MSVVDFAILTGLTEEGSTPGNRGRGIELKSKRVLRHPCWCLTPTGGRRAQGPAEAILPQQKLLGLRKSGPGTYRDPQPKIVALSIQKMRPDLLRHQGHSSLPSAQAA